MLHSVILICRLVLKTKKKWQKLAKCHQSHFLFLDTQQDYIAQPPLQFRVRSEDQVLANGSGWTRSKPLCRLAIGPSAGYSTGFLPSVELEASSSQGAEPHDD